MYTRVDKKIAYKAKVEVEVEVEAKAKAKTEVYAKESYSEEATEEAFK